MALDPFQFHAALVTPTGRLRVGYSHFSIGARGWPITLSMGHYHSARNIGFGPGFGSSFGVSLERDSNTDTLIIQEEDGTNSAYARLNQSEYEAVSGTIDARVFAFQDGMLERIFSDGSREVFDADGKLTLRIIV